MKKSAILKTLVSGALIASLALTATGCFEENNTKYSNENDALLFSTDALDGVFNPFYASSGPDSSIVSMTQMGMLGNDRNGNLTYGANEDVIVLDYKAEDNGGVKDRDLQTTYTFVLKNDVKFSNGSPLTIKDVLFNFYVFLDPSYYGSTTMYSTDIVGLKKYRTQEESEREQDNFNQQFIVEANSRMNFFVTALENIYDDGGYLADGAALREMLGDQKTTKVPLDGEILQGIFDKAVEFFKEEINTDWTAVQGTYQDHLEVDDKGTQYRNLFTSDVQEFYYSYGLITWDKKQAKMISNLNKSVEQLAKDSESEAKQNVLDDFIPYKVDQIVQWYATADTLYDYLVSTFMEEYFKEEGSVRFRSIDGIKFANATLYDDGELVQTGKDVTINGKTYPAIGDPMDKNNPNYNADGSPKSGYYEILQITINNVDPKAEYNFGIGIAPMYYYSNAEQIAKFDYVNNFGVEYGARSFMDDTIKAEEKISVPVGAGPYMAAKNTGGTTGVTRENFYYQQTSVFFERNPHFNMGDGPNGTAKIKSVRFRVATQSQMINTLSTKALDFVEPAAKRENVNELTKKGYKKGDGYEITQTNGYGYIGVNAKFVPVMQVRQAIMHSIDVQSCADYYGDLGNVLYRSMSQANWVYSEFNDLKAKPAYYPYIGNGKTGKEGKNGVVPANLDSYTPGEDISEFYVDWVYDNGLKPGDQITPDLQRKFIKDLLEDGGCKPGADGTYSDRFDNKLKYTFTVVGSESDHPAWNALLNAGVFLSSCGFDINVKTDSAGLSKLNSGQLSVWAAAWGAAIDPDMYQVYHMDSTANSTLNWGYREIKNNQNKYPDEYRILRELSELIDEGREYTAHRDRKDYYVQALDKLMELAVELPTYQRSDLAAWNNKKINSNTLVKNPSPFYGLTSEIFNISLRVS